MMLSKDSMPIIDNIMETLPESEWIEAIKKALPKETESDIIRMVMFLNVGDVVDLEEYPC